MHPILSEPNVAHPPVTNHLREAILQYQDGTAFLRVYEGLTLVGKPAGQAVIEREVLELLSS